MLEGSARLVAGLHTHRLIRATEFLPTRNHIEPYKPSFELLLQEIPVQLKRMSGQENPLT